MNSIIFTICIFIYLVVAISVCLTFLKNKEVTETLRFSAWGIAFNNFLSILFYVLLVLVSYPINSLFFDSAGKTNFVQSFLAYFVTILIFAVYFFIGFFFFIPVEKKGRKDAGKNALRRLLSVSVVGLLLYLYTIFVFVDHSVSHSVILSVLSMPFLPIIGEMTATYAKGNDDFLFLCFSIVPSLFLWFGLLFQSRWNKKHKGGRK
jgi:hypothetical protein